jgi:CubicO group peptidase (beta-lactamase class C family)
MTIAAIREDPEFQAALRLIEAEIENDTAARVAPGLSAAVVCGAETVWQKGFGVTDLEQKIPARPDTVYAVGSITKLFTATMLMQLRDAGKLRLDDPVQPYLPDIPLPHRHAGAPAITFRHLATHTSGLDKDSPAAYWDSVQFAPIETIIAKLAETGQPYPPGVQWKYSNLGITLLGHALARIAGQPWDSYVHDHILAPLGMHDTSPRFAEKQRAKLARGYARATAGWPPAPLPHQDLGGISAAGAMHSTVADMAHFVAQQFTDAPKLLPRASIAEMHRPQYVDESWEWGQGIGWRVHRADDGSTRIEHGGGVWGYTCRVLLSVPETAGVAVFTNGSDGNVGVSVSNRALDLLVLTVRRITARRAPPVSPAPPQWLRYVGLYRWVLGDAEVHLRDGRLVLSVDNRGKPETVVLQSESEHVFRMPGGPQRGETLRFIVDGSAPAHRVWLGPHPHDRI